MSIISSIIGSSQTSSAVNAETGALNQAINQTNSSKGMAVNAVYGGISNANSLLQPYMNLGTSATQSLASAVAPGGSLTSQFSFDPSQIASDPGYQFALQQGTGAVQKAAAANGTLNSGGTQKSLAQYASGLASQYENQDYTQGLNTFNTNRNATLQNLTLPLQVGQGATSQAQGNIMSGNSQIANMTQQTSGMLNNLLEGIGGAQAAGSVAQGNIWSNFANNLFAPTSLASMATGGTVPFTFPGGTSGYPGMQAPNIATPPMTPAIPPSWTQLPTYP